MTRQELYRQAEEYKEKLGVMKSQIDRETSPSKSGISGYIQSLGKEKEIQITEGLLKKIHELILKEKGLIEEGGNYRDIMIKGINPRFPLPKPHELEHLMSHFISQMKISRQMFHPIEFAAICHKRILEICPFKERNEEVAMWVMNLILVHEGYEMITSFKEQEEYLKVLEAAQHPSSPDIDSFIYFIAQCVVKVEQEKYSSLSTH